jgi:hypothetical protein
MTEERGGPEISRTAPAPGAGRETVQRSPWSFACRTRTRALPSTSRVTPVARPRRPWTRLRLARSASSAGDSETGRLATNRSPGKSANSEPSRSSGVAPSELATRVRSASRDCRVSAASSNSSRRAWRGGTGERCSLRPSWARTRRATCFLPDRPSTGRGSRRRASNSRWARPTKRSRSSRRTLSQGWSDSRRSRGTTAFPRSL